MILVVLGIPKSLRRYRGWGFFIRLLLQTEERIICDDPLRTGLTQIPSPLSRMGLFYPPAFASEPGVRIICDDPCRVGLTQSPSSLPLAAFFVRLLLQASLRRSRTKKAPANARAL
jgi:hypothetical protein